MTLQFSSFSPQAVFQANRAYSRPGPVSFGSSSSFGDYLSGRIWDDMCREMNRRDQVRQTEELLADPAMQPDPTAPASERNLLIGEARALMTEMVVGEELADLTASHRLERAANGGDPGDQIELKHRK